MARDMFTMTVARRHDDGYLEPLNNVEVTVWKAGAPKDNTNANNLATIYQTATSGAQGPRVASGATGVNPFTTGPTGLAEFFADQGRYEITWRDLSVPARLAANLNDPIHFNSAPMGIGELLTSSLSPIAKANLAAVVQDMLWQTGDVKPIAYASAAGSEPAGWLLCDGRAVSRTAYAALFATVGVVFGPGDGATTFNLPDFRGRMLIGTGQGTGLSARALGAKGGVENVALAIGEVPWHSHVGTTGAENSSLAHAHSGATGGIDRGIDHLHGLPAPVPGRSGGIAWDQGFAGTQAAIVAAAFGSDIFDVSGVNGADRTMEHAHGFATNTTGPPAHTHNFTTNNTGGNDAHTNMPPFAAVNYLIKT